jgi:tripartite-type tricarboxylate transporter receptor subunit TctC
MARAIGKAMGDKFKQTVIVENRPGASGMIGTSVVARAPGDPYTLLLGSSAEMSINPYLYANISYSPEKDFVPVAFAGKLPLVLVANPSVPADTLKGVIELARRKPNSLSFGSAGVGQTAHLGLEMIMKQTGVKMVHVPYKGGSEAVMGVVSNQVQLFLSGLPPALPQIKAGKLRALAVSTRERAPQLPDVPTVEENGIKGFDIYNWFAVFAPAGTSPQVVSTLNKAIDEAVRSPQLQEVWKAQGIVAQSMTPDALKDFVAAESRKYRDVIKATQVKAE